MKIRIRLLVMFLLSAQWLFAQQAVTLSDCQQWAREVHPLLNQKDLYKQMAELKTENIRTAWLPQVGVNAQASYQSDVTHVGISLSGVNIPTVSKDQYKAYLDVKQNIWDGGVSKARSQVERAQESANQQGVEVDLYKVKEQVNNFVITSYSIHYTKLYDYIRLWIQKYINGYGNL